MSGIEGIRLVDALPGPDAYFALFESTGWNQEYGLTAEELRRAVSRSWLVVSAYDEDRLIGTGRVVSDGVLHGLIVDVIVLPEYQGRGIGTLIMRRLLDCCKAAGLRDVQLFCARGKAPFYGRLGFAARPEDAPGMDYKGTS